MNNFTYYNPVKVVFGKGSIQKIRELVPAKAKILITYGGGSIFKNGVYDQVMTALPDRQIFQFGGIEVNPDFATLMKAVEVCKKENIDFLLSVGGGSVLDGTKFIAAAVFYNGDPWDILAKKKGGRIEKCLPIGCVMTLAATGSELNGFSVVSRRETNEKLSFGSSLLYPVFSILDPETTKSLSLRQTANGIVDAFIHVMEQYLTYDINTPLQDRQAESILKTLLECGEAIMKAPDDYNVRANIMWCAAQALNGLIGCGVIQDWTSHHIGHELTAFCGLDHARSLALVFPVIVMHEKKSKQQKFLQYGQRVLGVTVNEKNTDSAFAETLKRTVDFFHSLEVNTRLRDYYANPSGVNQDEKWVEKENLTRDSFQEIIDAIADRLSKRGVKLGEHKSIGYEEIKEILNLCW